ncbi:MULTISPECIES: MCE family protein [Prauserella salsuginis group]|uniref:MCE family protein n=1 Tax=Prauserella salsuginis TaxID=387889 RepID=A0ABW6G421_9PSEU|nr:MULTISPECIES: MCE family protein [Prauserella salsuginis group]MCR3718321.1 phospholipid/cholesterol/gamma-HCH transport system substrate-binding protein [Prauserella flava]MCR3732891.1 phospholipid/cholesterol/gamma-HCH transport system substrate-binding protein [Prauserella salsuginis]
MTPRTPRTLVAVALSAALLPAAGCGISLQRTASFGGPADTYSVTAVFADAANLPEGGIVRIGQAEVGRVTAIRAERFRAHVDLEIDTSVRLPADTGARLELTSALGDQFVVLEPPRSGDRAGGGPGRPRSGGVPAADSPAGGRTLADAARIPFERTSRGPDVEDTLAALGTLLNGSGLDQARTVVREVNTALGGREAKVRRIVERLDDVLGRLARRGDQITGVIDSMDTVAATLKKGTPTLEKGLTDIQPGLQTLLDERTRFTTLLRSVGSLGATTRTLIDKTGGALTQQLDELRPVLHELSTLDSKLGPTLQSLTRFSRALRSATPGDYLNLDGTVNVPTGVAELLDIDLYGENSGPPALDLGDAAGAGNGGGGSGTTGAGARTRDPGPGGLHRLLGGGLR